jgi:hypothetical protein
MVALHDTNSGLLGHPSDGESWTRIERLVGLKRTLAHLLTKLLLGEAHTTPESLPHPILRRLLPAPWGLKRHSARQVASVSRHLRLQYSQLQSCSGVVPAYVKRLVVLRPLATTKSSGVPARRRGTYASVGHRPSGPLASSCLMSFSSAEPCRERWHTKLNFPSSSAKPALWQQQKQVLHNML